jgi:hypothetical protein
MSANPYGENKCYGPISYLLGQKLESEMLGETCIICCTINIPDSNIVSYITTRYVEKEVCFFVVGSTVIIIISIIRGILL